MTDVKKLRELAEKLPRVQWTRTRSNVCIPETEDAAGKYLPITGLDKQYARRLAAFIAAANPATILALLDELDRTRWQPIATAPRDGTLILLGARNGVWVGKYVPVYQSGYRPANPWSSMLMNHDHMAERYTQPTHWQPLPAPPAALNPTTSEA